MAHKTEFVLLGDGGLTLEVIFDGGLGRQAPLPRQLILSLHQERSLSRLRSPQRTRVMTSRLNKPAEHVDFVSGPVVAHDRRPAKAGEARDQDARAESIDDS